MSESHRTRRKYRDPLIDEVRAIRKAICDQFDNDVDRLCEHLREIEREYGNQVIERLPTGSRRAD